MKTLLSSLLLVLCITVQAQITSTFDTDADGWTFYNASFASIAVTHNPANGNPGGYVSVTYSSASNTTNANTNLNNQVWFAPTKFLGNHLVKSLGMNLKFDLQQSQAGIASGVDVVIQSGGTYIYFNLPVKPAVAPGWSSYSLSLDETLGWIYSSGATIATRSQIKSILTNVTSIEIRGTYATNAAYTSGLDNVILEQRILTPAPVASSLSATSGKPGDVTTIIGSGFNATASNNIVSFGVYAGTKAVVQSATATQLQVVVPSGAVYGPITITNTATGLTSKTSTPFNPLFDGGGRIIPASFKNQFFFSVIDIEGLFVGDIDGDGWEDFGVANNNADNAIDIYRNLGLGGPLSTSSFAAKVSFAIPPLAGGGANGAGLWFADLDGDGKLDAISSNKMFVFGAAGFVTLRNISTPGNMAFEAPEYWVGGSDETPISLVSDLDGDGRPEMLSGEGSQSGLVTARAMWGIQNISTVGNIEFGVSTNLFGPVTIDGFGGVTSGDLDGDGKAELLACHTGPTKITVFHNISTPGTPAFNNPFTITTNQYTYAVHTVDMNLDGKNDLIYKVSGETGVHIRLNSDADGMLTAADFTSDIIVAGDLSTYGGISIADVNGDGKPDILESDNGDMGVYENVFAGGVFDANAFVPAYQYQGNGNSTYPTFPQAADFNHDGKPDIIMGITNTSPDRVSIFENKNVHAPAISVNTISPLKGAVGSTVTITGNNFSIVPSENIVWFGTVKATVLTAAENLLTVEVPDGATYAPVSVTKNGLTSRYHLPFQTTFGPGVTFDNTHFAPPINYTLSGATYNVEAGDLNNDGTVDIFASAGNVAYAFRNDYTTGSITASTLIANDTLLPLNALFGNPRLEDFDGDGYLDVASTNTRIRRNITTGSNINFTPNITFSGQGNLAYADFNQDGKIDMAISNSGAAQLLIVENRTVPGDFITTGAFGSFSSAFAISKPGVGGDLIAADFDADGFPDVVTVNSTTDNISIFRNTGDKRISATQLGARVDIAVGDNPNRIYKGDFDSDGKLDLMLYHGAGTSTTLVIVFQNTSTVGNISFSRIDLTNPSAATVAHIADLDGDGKPEILTTSEAGNRFSIFKNIHTSGALNAASFAAPFNTTVTAPRGITTGDLNLDGKPEIILTRATGLLVVYENLVSTTQNFITQWNLATAGSGATQLTFGTATSGTVNYTWQQLPSGASGSGSWSGATLTITGLPTGATIRLQIAPTNFQRIIINTGADRNRLRQVEQWGTTAWTSMQSAFVNCSNLQVTANDVPDLSGVTNMSGMFRGCSTLNSPSNIGSWNTSSVTDMSALFSTASAFNQNISAWNTGAVTNMSNLFADAAVFNQDIGVWNIAAVTNMAGMFAGAIVFNRNIGGWNTAAVTNMNSMFFSAYVFNQNITGWNTAAVTNMASMFGYAYDFNQNIGVWNTAAVTNMSRMFEDAFDFNQNIGTWNTSAVTNMRGMFIDAYAFNQNIGTWNTSAVTDMSRMFDFATAFNQNIGVWNTSAVTDMSGMFADASAFNQNIGTWSLNPGVLLTGMLNNSGINCSNYSATLLAWSANPSTPNGRSLGATGRQYGTNAVAARTNLTATKGWTITGDTPSGTICSSVSAPTITNFTPTSGPVGTTVTITGTNFNTTPANNTVQFNGTTAVVTASTATSITTSVQTGATTGKISVTVGGNTVNSSTDFTVTTGTGGGAVTITAEPLGTSIGGTITKNLVPLITVLNGSLNINSITVIVQPPSGAMASVVNGELRVDYTNIVFSGKENVTIRACDNNTNCATQQFEIEVAGDVIVFNALSPNGENPSFVIQYIEIIPETKNNTVTIFDRWQNEVWKKSNYNNSSVVFAGISDSGSDLPTGIYFYKIEFASGRKTLTGFISLKR